MQLLTAAMTTSSCECIYRAVCCHSVHQQRYAICPVCVFCLSAGYLERIVDQFGWSTVIWLDTDELINSWVIVVHITALVVVLHLIVCSAGLATLGHTQDVCEHLDGGVLGCISWQRCAQRIVLLAVGELWLVDCCDYWENEQELCTSLQQISCICSYLTHSLAH